MTTVLDGRSTEPFTQAAQTPRADRVDRVDRAAPSLLYPSLASPPLPADDTSGVATAPWPEPEPA